MTPAKRYLAEFNARYSHRIRLGVEDKQGTDLALLGAEGNRLTYETTRGQWAAEAVPFQAGSGPRMAATIDDPGPSARRVGVLRIGVAPVKSKSD